MIFDDLLAMIRGTAPPMPTIGGAAGGGIAGLVGMQTDLDIQRANRDMPLDELPPWPESVGPDVRTVTRVKDGDTLVLDNGYGTARLYLPGGGLDAQELGEPGGLEMRRWLERFVGRQVRVKESPEGRDAYGRALVSLTDTTGEFDINAALQEKITDFSEHYISLAPESVEVANALAANTKIGLLQGLSYPIGMFMPQRQKTWQGVREMYSRRLAHAWQAEREREGRPREGPDYEDLQSMAALAGGAPAFFAGMMIPAIPLSVAANAITKPAMALTKVVARDSQFTRALAAGAMTDTALSVGAHLEDGQSRMAHIAISAAIGAALEPVFVLPFMKVAIKNELGEAVTSKAIKAFAKKTGLSYDQASTYLAGLRAAPAQFDEDAVKAAVDAFHEASAKDPSRVVPDSTIEQNLNYSLAVRRHLLEQGRPAPRVVAPEEMRSGLTSQLEIDMRTPDLSADGGYRTETFRLRSLLGSVDSTGEKATLETQKEELLNALKVITEREKELTKAAGGMSQHTYTIGEVRAVDTSDQGGVESIFDLWKNHLDPGRKLRDRYGAYGQGANPTQLVADGVEKGKRALSWESPASAAARTKKTGVKIEVCGSPCETSLGQLLPDDEALPSTTRQSVWSRKVMNWRFGRFRANVPGVGEVRLNEHQVFDQLSELDRHVLLAQQVSWDARVESVKAAGRPDELAQTIQRAQVWSAGVVRNINATPSEPVSELPSRQIADRLLDLEWEPGIRGSKKGFWNALKELDLVSGGQAIPNDEKYLMYVTSLTDHVLRHGELTATQSRAFPYLRKLADRIKAGEITPAHDVAPSTWSNRQTVIAEDAGVLSRTSRGLDADPSDIESRAVATARRRVDEIQEKLDDLPAEEGVGAGLYQARLVKGRARRAPRLAKQREALRARLRKAKARLAKEESALADRRAEAGRPDPAQLALAPEGAPSRISLAGRQGWSGRTQDIYGEGPEGGVLGAGPPRPGDTLFSQQLLAESVDRGAIGLAPGAGTRSPYDITTGSTRRQLAEPEDKVVRQLDAQIQEANRKITALKGGYVVDPRAVDDPVYVHGQIDAGSYAESGERILEMGAGVRTGAPTRRQIMPGETLTDPQELEFSLQEAYEELAALKMQRAERLVQSRMDRMIMELNINVRRQDGIILERGNVRPDALKKGMEELGQLQSRATYLESRIGRMREEIANIKTAFGEAEQIRARPGERLVEFRTGEVKSVPGSQLQVLRAARLEPGGRPPAGVPHVVVSAYSTNEPMPGMALFEANRRTGVDPETGLPLAEPEPVGHILIPKNGQRWPWMDQLAQQGRQIDAGQDPGIMFYVQADGTIQISSHDTRAMIPVEGRSGNATEAWGLDEVLESRARREALESRERMAIPDSSPETAGFPSEVGYERSTVHAASPHFMKAGRRAVDPEDPIIDINRRGGFIERELMPPTPEGPEFVPRQHALDYMSDRPMTDLSDPTRFRYEHYELYDEWGNVLPTAEAFDALRRSTRGRQTQVKRAIAGEDAPHDLQDLDVVFMDDVAEETMSGGTRLRGDIDQGIQILDPQDVRLGLAGYTVLDAPRAKAYQIDRNYLTSQHTAEGHNVWAGGAPSRIVHAIHTARKLIGFGLDPDSPVAVMNSPHGNRWVPDIPPNITLKELAEANLPQPNMSLVFDAAASLGAKAEFRGTGVSIRLPGDAGATHFDEAAEALEYLYRIQGEPMPAQDLTEGASYLLNVGTAKYVDFEIDGKSWAPFEMQELGAGQVRTGQRPVFELRHSNEGAFQKAFDVASGQDIGSRAATKYDVDAQGNMIVPNTDLYYIDLSRKAGVSQGMRGHHRVAMINGPAARKHLQEYGHLLDRIGIDIGEVNADGVLVNTLDEIVRKLDLLPAGMDFFSDDALSAVMYTFQRQKGLDNWFMASGRQVLDDGTGPRRIYSQAEKDAWYWNVCR